MEERYEDLDKRERELARLDQLTDYEIERENNMARNGALLKSLGVKESVEALLVKVPTGKPKAKAKAKAKPATQTPPPPPPPLPHRITRSRKSNPS